MDEIILHVSGLKGFFDDARASVRRIDAGDYTPRPARLGFESASALFETMTPSRWLLLDCLRRIGPSTRETLARALACSVGELDADLAKLQPLELVEEDETGLLNVPWSKITTEVDLGLSRAA